MGGYTKLFSDIITSSIWNEDDKTRVLWITMLALSNANGFVSGAPTSLALLARMSKEDCDKSLDVLSSPDPESRTPDHEGRRIERVQGGCQILNYEAYRERLSDDPNAVQARERMKKYRERKRNVTQRDGTERDTASASASGDASESEEKKNKEAKDKFGEFNNVRLTKTEYQKLLDQHGHKLAAAIDILDAYIEQSGKRYKSHYAVMKVDSWVWERVKEKQRSSEVSQPKKSWMLPPE